MHLHQKQFLFPLVLHFFFLTWLFLSPLTFLSHVLLPLASLWLCFPFFSFPSQQATHPFTHSDPHTHNRGYSTESVSAPWPGGVRIKRPWEPCTSDQPWRVSDCLLNLLWQMDRCTAAAVWVWNKPLKEYEERSGPRGENICRPPTWTSTHVPQRYVWLERQTCRKLQSS